VFRLLVTKLESTSPRPLGAAIALGMRASAVAMIAVNETILLSSDADLFGCSQRFEWLGPTLYKRLWQ
jgi:hypothetical protein